MHENANEKYLFDNDKVLVVNTVFTFHLGVGNIDIEALTPNIPCAYNKRQKPCTIRVFPDRCTCLVYPKGSAVIIGNTTVQAAVYTARIYCRMISRIINRQVKINDLYLKNITATIKLPFYIDTEKLLMNNPTKAEKGLKFPGVRFFLDRENSSIVQIVFDGMVLVTGANSIDQIVDFYHRTKPYYEACYMENATVERSIDITDEEMNFINSIIEQEEELMRV